MAHKTISDRDRFFERFLVSERGCWEWKLAPDKDGYGLFSTGSAVDGSARRVRAARYSYEELVGKIPKGMQIDHLCKNRICVNPEHLEPVTPMENIQRSANTNKTSCVNGHLYDEKNTYRTKHGYRCCRRCRNIKQRQFQNDRRLQSASATT